ncbi:proteasome regulatory particle base subunit rpn10 [Sorochytrium milnesiophthora]
MVLEATMLVIDNSEWMRNGDYTPSRIKAQSDAVTLLFNSKTGSNPENTVGLMTMAGKSPEVLVTLTSEMGKILSALHGVTVSGKANITTGIQVAQLALKHRQNRNQRQRVIVFVGSPLDVDDKALVRLGKKMKKNNVAIDVINFGEDVENAAKLEAFVNSVNSNDNSHLVSIPPGPHVLSDIITRSPILEGEEGAMAAAAASGGGEFEFGVDPSLDPELALALRISMEEERMRQEAANKGTKTEGGGDAMNVDQPAAAAAGSGTTEDDMVAKALAMSMGGSGSGSSGNDHPMEELSEEEQIQRAIQMSMQEDQAAAAQSSSGNNANLADILGSLPGVDPNDPRIKDAMKKKE